MSENVIKARDLETLKKLITFLMEVVMTSRQRAFLNIKLRANVSPVWLGNRTVRVTQIMLHDILDATKGKKTDCHVAGLTMSELYRIAILMGIPSEQIETNKTLIWQQIKRRLSPELSQTEAQTILYALLSELKEDEIEWLKLYRSKNWKDYSQDDREWIKWNATTIIDCTIRIDDILRQTDNVIELIRYNLRISNVDFLALLNRFGVPSSISLKKLPKGILKASLLRVIENKKSQNK